MDLLLSQTGECLCAGVFANVVHFCVYFCVWRFPLGPHQSMLMRLKGWERGLRNST